ncbi:rhodanese-like domain-containing protein [Glutamicibacter sp.]|uniref:rhodanese-like domain-containing protein n=1 Tax=Glutamicibacter sp. TaxID=1931995 RepID=UPI0028BDF818|nr:rhodanese-like domain-containing protein [Glutamicibacter sp.]
MNAPLPTINADELKTLLQTPDSSVAVLDVRTAGEFEAVHIPGSYNIPLNLLSEHADEVKRKLAKQVVLVCQSGNRATQAQQCLLDFDIDSGSVLAGGIAAFEQAGGTVIRGAQRWALDRQMRMTAGSVVLLGLAGAKFINPKFGYLAAAIGGGLVFSALRDSCPMISALAVMPWNKPKNAPSFLADIPNAGQQLRDTGK